MTEESGATCRPGQFASLGWGESGFRAARPEVAALVPGRVFVIRHESRLEREERCTFISWRDKWIQLVCVPCQCLSDSGKER